MATSHGVSLSGCFPLSVFSLSSFSVFGVSFLLPLRSTARSARQVFLVISSKKKEAGSHQGISRAANTGLGHYRLRPSHTKRKPRKQDFSIRGVVDYGPTMAMLAMPILILFWLLCWNTSHLHPPRGSTCRTALQPSHLDHARLARWRRWLLHGAFNVPQPCINPHMAMAVAMAGKRKNELWSELRYKGGCCCFKWAVHAHGRIIWACGHMDIWTLYNSKPPK